MEGMLRVCCKSDLYRRFFLVLASLERISALVSSCLVRIGGVVSSCFKVLKFCSQVSSQTNLADFFSSLIIGLVLSANLGRELATAH